MWQRLKNIIPSLRTYTDLRPDLKVRRRVMRALSDRPALSLDEWFETHSKPHGLSHALTAFAYSHLEKYSGLSLAQLLPSDRMEADLCWTQISWFDWQILLHDDLWQCFGVDFIGGIDEPSDQMPGTLGNFLQSLDQQIQQVLLLNATEPRHLDDHHPLPSDLDLDA